MIKTFKFKIYPTAEQTLLLNETLETCRHLYNRALAERKDSWEKEHKQISYYDQSASIKEQRASNPYLARLNFSASQDVLKRLDKAYKAFFRRIKAGETPGYPRFKGYGRYDSITYPSYGDGCKIKEGKLYLQYIGRLKIKLHREIEGVIKTVSIKRQSESWYAYFCVEMETMRFPPSDLKIGIDLGIENFAITSDAQFFPNNRYLKAAKKNVKRLQRIVSKRKKGSVRRKKAIKQLAKAHEHVANQRRDTAHKISRKLVDRYGLLAVENLNVSKMIQDGLLHKEILDAGWSMFIEILISKAEEAGRQIIKVDPAYTSQTCSQCGAIVKKKLSERWHACSCGCSLHRDVNAAKNILQRAVA